MIGSYDEYWLIVLLLQSVLAGLGGSGRVKYSCVDVGISILVFGANTGSIYFFDRGTRFFNSIFALLIFLFSIAEFSQIIFIARAARGIDRMISAQSTILSLKNTKIVSFSL